MFLEVKRNPSKRKPKIKRRGQIFKRNSKSSFMTLEIGY